MKYLFLEKNDNASENIKQKYAYNYYYYVTTIDDYIYNENTPKKEINFTSKSIFENRFFKIGDFTQSNSDGLQNIFGIIFNYVLSKNLLDKKIIKFTINDNEIEKVEFLA